jgi:hypothetical protein
MPFVLTAAFTHLSLPHTSKTLSCVPEEEGGIEDSEEEDAEVDGAATPHAQPIKEKAVRFGRVS